METLFSKALDGVANVVANKWYAVMGLVGLVLFATTLLVDLPTDQTVATCVSLMLMGWGFGQADCRKKVQRPVANFIVTNETWQLTVSGFIMFAIAGGAAIVLIRHIWI